MERKKGRRQINRNRNTKPRTDQQRRLHRRVGAQLKFTPTVPSTALQKAVRPLVLKCPRGGHGGSGRALLALTAAQLLLLQSNVALQEVDQAEDENHTARPALNHAEALEIA